MGNFARRFETMERRSNPATPTKFLCADKKSFSVCVIGYTLAGRVLTTSVMVGNDRQSFARDEHLFRHAIATE